MSQAAEPTPAPDGVKAYMAVTGAYWAFMLTDGALRMLVLLHFHQLGYSPIQLAYMFLLYELAGVITNFVAGWVGARHGLTGMLRQGLLLQITCLVLLAYLTLSKEGALSVWVLMGLLALSGAAKDFVKTSSKSAVKLLAPEGAGGLFRWVAVLTGSKNAIKGLGFLLGALLLGFAGFVPALFAMAGFLALVLTSVVLWMPSGLPQGRKDAKFKEVFSKSRLVNWLSAARVFLFGARDVWFVVGIPIYFYAVLSDGSEEGNRAAFFAIGSFMAVWTILYGGVQAAAPKLLRGGFDDLRRAAPKWLGGLAAIPLLLAATVWSAEGAPIWLTLTLVGGLMAFGAVFAVNSSLHSYMILAASDDKRVSMDVGFYYMANAVGRLLGTLLSGLCYQSGGLALCLGVAGGMILLSMLCTFRLHPAQDPGRLAAR